MEKQTLGRLVPLMGEAGAMFAGLAVFGGARSQTRYRRMDFQQPLGDGTDFYVG